MKTYLENTSFDYVLCGYGHDGWGDSVHSRFVAALFVWKGSDSGDQ